MFKVFHESALAKMPEEIAQLLPYAEKVLQEELDAVVAAESALAPIAGGRSDGTAWTDHQPAAQTVLVHFGNTLDKVNPGPMDKACKALAKVGGHCEAHSYTQSGSRVNHLGTQSEPRTGIEKRPP